MQEDKKIEEYVIYDDLDLVQEGKGEGWLDKTKDFVSGKYFVLTVVILLVITAFSLGRISGLQEKKPAVRVLNNFGEVRGASTQNEATPAQNDIVQASSGQVVASKNGTKYHYPWCAGAKQISDKNKITFNSTEEARAKGYTPASNCKGLK